MLTSKPGYPLDYVPEINSLKSFRTAFLKAKKAFKVVHKTQDNPFFHSKYADLASIHAAVDEALLANGFILMQIFRATENANFLQTTLAHIDGHQETSELLLQSKDDTNPQSVKSSATYYRRIALEALLTIATEDDDGNKASQANTTATQATKASSTTNAKVISAAQAKRFYAIANNHGWVMQEINELLTKWGYKAAEDIRWPDYADICSELERGPASKGHKDFEPDTEIRNPFES